MDRKYDVITFISTYLFLRGPRVAIFADIISNVTMFITTIFKDSKKSLKNYLISSEKLRDLSRDSYFLDLF